MSVTVVGSIAFDQVKTPFGERERMLGGAAVHFSLATSFFSDVSIVGPIGDDFGAAEYEILHKRGVNTDDIRRNPNGKTFFWQGHYEWDMNVAHTDDTQLGVFADFAPELSPASRDCDVLFLANIQPQLQLQVRKQCENARFVALDSMNYWITSEREALVKVIQTIDCLVINDAEIRQLTEQSTLLGAARKVMEWGPRVVICKQGEYGSALFIDDHFFGLPAYPLERVIDPTGAGDTFAAGFIGYIAAHPDKEIDHQLLRRAMAYGTVMASFNVEQFGTERMQSLTREEITKRVGALCEMTSFTDVPVTLRA